VDAAAVDAAAVAAARPFLFRAHFNNSFRVVQYKCLDDFFIANSCVHQAKMRDTVQPCRSKYVLRAVFIASVGRGSKYTGRTCCGIA